MKIKLFVAREIQSSELGIFSFNSYVYYLTDGFIASTRAFTLPTRAFNLATRAFSVLTRRFELVTRGFELVTRALLFHFCKNYKNFDNITFNEALNRELMKHDLKNIGYEIFQEIVLSILNAHAPSKKKHPKAYHAAFVTKEFRKAVKKRARLRKAYLKNELKQIKRLIIISETFVLVLLGTRKGLILKTLMYNS